MKTSVILSWVAGKRRTPGVDNAAPEFTLVFSDDRAGRGSV